MFLCGMNSREIKPIAFYPYTSFVLDRIFDLRDYSECYEIRSLQERLIQLFNEHGIKAAYDNKIVFEIEYNGRRFFYGFKDWNFSIGLGVRSDPWIKPITAEQKE